MTEYVGASDAGVDYAHAIGWPRTGTGNTRTLAPRRSTRAVWLSWYQRRAFGLDLLAAAVAAAALLLAATEPHLWGWLEPLALIPLWLVLLGLNKSYAARHVGDGIEEYRAVLRSGLHLFSLVAAWALVTGHEPNLWLVASVVGGLPVATATSRKILRTRSFHDRVAGRNLQRVVVVGNAAAAGAMVRSIRSNPAQTGLSVVAICAEGAGSDPEVRAAFAGLPVFDNPHSALQAAERYDADVVAIASQPDLVGHSMRRLSWALEARGIDLMVDPGIVEVAGPRLSLRPVAGLSLLHVERPVANALAYRVKLYAERLIAAVALALLAPLFAVIAILIRRDSPGPVFFRQARLGAGGQVFTMIKFRSMIPDAELAKAKLTGGYETNEMLFKQVDDPRVTRVGRWLRRYSIDELPQLINVVRGEMSLVGPRPPLQTEVDGYTADAYRRLKLQPGMTGLWQVSGRSDLSWEESLRFDLWYVDNWSVAVDLQILVRTFRAVVNGSGAY